MRTGWNLTLINFVIILVITAAAVHARSAAMPSSANGITPPTYLEIAERGNSTYNTGSKISRIGLYTAAFGGSLALISVANPDLIDLGFAPLFGTIAAGGGALVFIGIPIMGHGADKSMEAAKSLNLSFQSPTPNGWPLYRQSWKWIGAGVSLLPFAVGFGVIGALDWEDPSNKATMIGAVLLSTSLSMGAVGFIEQGFCWYRFSRRHRHANAGLGQTATISLQPLIQVTRQGFEGGGIRLVADF